MKKDLRKHLENRNLDAIADLASNRKRTLGMLVSLTYDADPLIGWRAVEAIGVAADRIAEKHPEFVRGHLRRLHWMLSDECGGICLHAPPALAETIVPRPTLFEDYKKIAVNLIQDMAEEDLAHFRNGILWAIGRLAPVASEDVAPVVPLVEKSLDDEDTQIRGMAVWCLRQAGREDLIDSRPGLLSDDGEVEIYTGGELRRTTVAALARGDL
jgi:hypothetical protein